MKCERSALVLGNGFSRLAVDVKRVYDEGRTTIIGCNSAALDVPLHMCVFISGNILRVLQKAERTGPEYVNPGTGPRVREQIAGKDIWYLGDLWKRIKHGTPYADQGDFSGPIAAGMAAYLGAEVIYLAGFDVGRKNIYHGTEGYIKGHWKRMKASWMGDRIKYAIEGGARVGGHEEPAVFQFPPATFAEQGWCDELPVPTRWRAHRDDGKWPPWQEVVRREQF